MSETIPPGEADSFSFFDAPASRITAKDEAEAIDAEVVNHSRLKSDPETRFSEKKDDKAKASAPRLDEWQDFFSRVLIRAATDFYVDAAFRGIDEDMLSEREVEKIHLSETERNRIAKPFAELAHRTKFTRKHGRAIISLSDSIDSVIQLGMWFSRVNRIASKYRDRPNLRPGNGPAMWAYRRPAEPVIRMPRIDEEDYEDVSAGQGTEEGSGISRGGNRKPHVGAPVFVPGG